MDTQNTQDPMKLALETGHYPTFAMALGIAMTRCLVWKFQGNTYDAFQLAKFAETFDVGTPRTDGSFYMVSMEGAIGASPGVEYLTQWLFLPVSGAAERDAALEQMRQRVRAAASQINSAPDTGRCLHCGAAYESPDDKFCTHCGAPRK